jgi:hypothetical protein
MMGGEMDERALELINYEGKFFAIGRKSRFRLPRAGPALRESHAHVM